MIPFLDRNGTIILTATLALFYILLGASSLDLPGVLGILGGIGILAMLALRQWLGRGTQLAILAVATLPFAVLVWWSVAVPAIGVLLLLFGSAATRGRVPAGRSVPLHSPSTGPLTPESKEATAMIAAAP